MNCHAEQVERAFKDGKTFYTCNNCGVTLPRSLVIDPQVTWWIDPDTNEYWHESVGMIIRNNQQQILLFERTIYPFANTIPAGHLDTGEDPQSAAIREAEEEVGFIPENVSLFTQEDVVGDECRRGADSHKWSLFLGQLPAQASVKVNDEGLQPTWLTIEQALAKDLTFPLRYFLEKYGSKLLG